MSTAISVRLPEYLAQELGEVAKEADRSKSYLIQKAIEAYLGDLADLQVSMDRLRDTTDPIVTLEDMRTELGL